VASTAYGGDVSPKERELPSFAFPRPSQREAALDELGDEPPRKRTKREIGIENLKKARASPRNDEMRMRRVHDGIARNNRQLTMEEAMEIFQAELMTEGMVRQMAKIMKRQAREGSQQSRYRAMLDWRDQVLGKPKLSKDDDEIVPPTIVIRSPIFGRIAEAAQKQDDAGD
jgi:hypothetical protein